MIPVLAISRMSSRQSGWIAISSDGRADRAESERDRCRGFALPQIPEPEAAKATGELPPAKTRGKLFPTATH